MSQTRFASAKSDHTRLFQPLTFTLSGRTTPNRLLKAAMSECLATWHPTEAAARGIPTPQLTTLYKHWLAGGWGIVLSGNIMADSDNLEARGNMIIPPDAPFSGPRFEAYRALAATKTVAPEALLIGQLSFAGRQSNGDHPISASGLHLVVPGMGRTFKKPRIATTEDLAAVVESFAHAAEYLDKAGWDGIELHAAHGFILSEFFSRRSNKRTDAYGGSVANRARLTLETIAAIRARVRKSFVVAIKINAIEYTEDGVTPEESRELCEMLDKAGVDFIELSGGSIEKLGFMHIKEATKKYENYFLQSVLGFRDVVKTAKLFTVGGFHSVGGMDAALDEVDGVGIGRAACWEPRFPKELLANNLSGFLQSSIADGDFLTKLVAACSQIRQIGDNREPLDLSVPENIQRLGEDMAAQAAEAATDDKKMVYGWPAVAWSAEPYKA